MKSNNIELVNDVIDFIISDTPDFRERDSKVLFSTIFKESTEINIGDYMIKWLKKIFTKEKTFDDFLKELVKERRQAKYVKGTRDTGPH